MKKSAPTAAAAVFACSTSAGASAFKSPERKDFEGGDRLTRRHGEDELDGSGGPGARGSGRLNVAESPPGWIVASMR